MRTKWLNIMVLAAMLLGMIPMTVSAAPENRGLMTIAGSNVTFDDGLRGYDEGFIPGDTHTFCFLAESYTTDWEWLNYMWLRFPSDWTVTGVWDDGPNTCASGGSFGAFSWNSHAGNLYEVRISQTRRHTNPSDHCWTYYCVDVVAGATPLDADVSWFFRGDGWGATPHYVCSSDNYTPSGEPACQQAVDPPAVVPVMTDLVFTPGRQQSASCLETDIVYTFELLNRSGITDTVELSVAGNDWPTIVEPITVTLAHDETAPVTVTVSIPGYAFDGDVDVATINAVLQSAIGGWAIVETTAGNVWLEGPRNNPTLWPAFAGDGDALFYFDGRNQAGTPTDQVQVFDLANGWTTGHGLGGFYGGVAGYNGLGGFYGGVAGYKGNTGEFYYAPGFAAGMMATDAFATYDPAGDSWTVLASRPAALGLGAGGVTGDGDTFVWAGGSPNAGLLGYTPVYTYDIGTDTWYTATTLADVGFTAPGYVMVGDDLYVGGSYFSSNLFYVYNVTADVWTQLADLPTGLISPLFIHEGDYIYAIGGGDSPTHALNYTWIYDITANAWMPFAPLNTATLGNGGGVIDGILFTYGGGAGVNAARTPASHEYNLPLCSALPMAVLEGYVTNGVTGDPIEGALVEVVGTGYNTLMATPMAYTDADGYYMLELFPATYDVTASFGDFDPQMVNIPVAGTTQQDFVLGPAAVEADPLSFAETLYYGETRDVTMTVTNTGYSELALELLEYNGGFTPAAVQVTGVTVPARDRRDYTTQPLNFELLDRDKPFQPELAQETVDVTPPSVIEASEPSAIGAASTPFAVLNALWDNGPLVTHPGGGAGGNDASALQTAMLGIYGFGNQFSAGNRIADDFTVPAGGWTLDQITFFAYQSFAGPPSTITGVYYQIWDGPPNDPSSTVVFGDLTTNRLINTVWMNAYRVLDTNLTNTDRPIMANTASAGVFLPAGDYWLDWMTDGSAASGPWAPPISILGQPATGNGMQYTGAWAPADDTGYQQGFPFIIEGAGGAASIPIPWLTETPTQTVLLPGESAIITLTFDAGVVDALGIYTGNLVLAGGYMPITVPVQMTVMDNFAVDPDVLEKTVEWGSTDIDPVALINHGPLDVGYGIYLWNLAFYEDFEGSFPPAGWTVVDNTSGSTVWQAGSVCGYGNSTPGTGEFADANSDCVWLGPEMNTELRTPSIDMSSFSGAVELWFAAYHWNWTGEHTRVWASGDGGATWDLLFDINTGYSGWVGLDLSAYAGRSAVQISFQYDDTGTGGWTGYWQIDDVEIWTYPSWLEVAPDTGTVLGEETDVVTFTYRADWVEQPGDYHTTAWLYGNPIIPDVRPIDVTLHVVPPADAFLLEGTVTGNRTPDGDGMPLEGVEITVEGPFMGMLHTDAVGEYAWWFMGANAGVYTLTYAAPNYLTQVITRDMTITGTTYVVDVELILDSSFLQADPEALSDTLTWGETADHTVIFENADPAQRVLDLQVIELMGGFTPMAVQTVQVQIPAFTATGLNSDVQLNAFAPQAGRAAQTLGIELNNLALGKIKVLIVSSDWPAAGDLGGMDAILGAYPDLQVDIYPMDREPTLAELLEYDVVIVGSQYTWEAAYDHNLLGDVMADYVDAGGGVIQAFGTMHGTPSGSYYWALGGRWQVEEYSPMTYSTFYNLWQTRVLGVHQAGHPLMRGVTTITDYFVYGADLMVRPDAEAVAYYDNGVPYLATYPGSIVALNQAIFNGANWAGDLPTLLHNAILYVAPTDVPWLSETPVEFTLGVGYTATMTVSLDAGAVDQPGTYTAWLWLDNNDLLQRGAYIPVELTVLPTPDMARLEGIVMSDRLQAPMEGAMVMMDMTTPMYMFTDEAGHFSHWFMPSEVGTYDLVASMPGYISETISIDITSGTTTTVDIELKMDAPWLQYTEPVLDVRLPVDTLLTQTMVLENAGQRPLEFEWLEIPPTVTVPLANLVLGQAPVILDETPLSIDPLVTADLAADGTVDFWVRLRQGVDLSGAAALSDKTARGTYVYNNLRAVADQSQRNVVAYLESQGLAYEQYWIVNAVLVYDATEADMQALSAMPEVAEIKGRFYGQLHNDPAPTFGGYYSSLAALQRPAANPDWEGTAWGLIFTRADQVWDQFGITGEGIVVGNIDTGVQWDHPALVNQYRGGDGDHDYHWYPPTAAAQSACPGASTAPCDWSGHGSHTMGTMVGNDGVAGPTGHRTGMAPGATWMACMGCDLPPNSCSDAALTGCAEWFLAPTDLAGNNPDPSMAPDIINNSWGGGGGDTWYRIYVQNWVAAGIFPAFSAGNSGPGCSTTGSPGDYAESFAVGAVDSSGGIASFSSRGPGLVLGATQKPEISAPGVAVCSTVPGNGYSCGYSGTSMASPHVAGAVALVWAANPALQGDIDATRQLLIETVDPNVPDEGNCGKPPGTPGLVPNYTYGFGYLDAFAAVDAVMLVYDVPWLSTDPVTGTIPVMELQDASIIFNATDMEPGIYTATLMLNHNDPMIGRVAMPVTMTVFAPQELLVTVVGSGTVTQDPLPPYAIGDVVTLTATADAHWTFVGWSGDVVTTTNPLVIEITGDTLITATFMLDEYMLDVDIVGEGTVDVDPEQATYHYGDVVTLTATADLGWTFAGWSGDVTGTDEVITVTIMGDHVITATFIQDAYMLDVNIVGEGTVDIDPDQAAYSYGDTITLTATPAEGWQFVGWSGDFTGTDEELVITITADTSITATFELIPAPDTYVIFLPLVTQALSIP